MSSRVQQQQILLSPGNSGTATLTGVAAGSVLIVRAGCYNTSGTATIAVSSTIGGSAANTWTVLPNRQAGTNSTHAAFAPNASAGTTVVTVTINGSTGDRYLTAQVEEWTGFDAAPTDQDTGNSGAFGTAANTGTTGTTTAANERVFVVFSVGQDAALSTPSGYTSDYLQNSNAVNQPLMCASKAVTSTGTQTASITLAVADDWSALIFTLKESGGGGGDTLMAQCCL